MQISPLLCSCLFILNSSIFLGYLFYMEKKTKLNNIIIENNKEKKNTPYYYFGCLCIKYENICVFIKIKGICEYISSFFDKKLLFVLFINFFSRAQKLKFKFEYKGILKIHENPGNILIINFIINYIIAVSIYYIFIKIDPNKNKLKEEEKINDKQENNIIKAICISNIILLIFSIQNFWKNEEEYNNFKKFSCYIAIAISGNINYLFYIFYSL